ncbi:Streptavidin [Mycena indigotica]|uniref:Streptavidin n=1 Tax=Mycena indigotica TaxID=2126181 RepID=A0A8H6SEM6_9AGAR|nr:Streptavidin [Mycena indigotica]KAF7297533.1 Streptavidin [Mycena indigotica]
MAWGIHNTSIGAWSQRNEASFILGSARTGGMEDRQKIIKFLRRPFKLQLVASPAILGVYKQHNSAGAAPVDPSPPKPTKLPTNQSKPMSVSSAFNFTRLTGTWHNELASVMHLKADGRGGLSGSYNSAVGNAQDNYVLTGRYDTTPPTGEGVALGWIVAWKNNELDAHSAAGWSGQFYAGASELEDIILTQWLLTTSTAPADNWESTQVGTDLFKHQEPTAAQVKRATMEGRALPHPEQIVAKRSRVL